MPQQQQRSVPSNIWGMQGGGAGARVTSFAIPPNAAPSQPSQYLADLHVPEGAITITNQNGGVFVVAERTQPSLLRTAAEAVLAHRVVPLGLRVRARRLFGIRHHPPSYLCGAPSRSSPQDGSTTCIDGCIGGACCGHHQGQGQGDDSDAAQVTGRGRGRAAAGHTHTHALAVAMDGGSAFSRRRGGGGTTTAANTADSRSASPSLGVAPSFSSYSSFGPAQISSAPPKTTTTDLPSLGVGDHNNSTVVAGDNTAAISPSAHECAVVVGGGGHTLMPGGLLPSKRPSAASFSSSCPTFAADVVGHSTTAAADACAVLLMTEPPSMNTCITRVPPTHTPLRWPVAASDLPRYKEAQRAATWTIRVGFAIGLIAFVSLHHMRYTRIKDGPNPYRIGSLLNTLLTPMGRAVGNKARRGMRQQRRSRRGGGIAGENATRTTVGAADGDGLVMTANSPNAGVLRSSGDGSDSSAAVIALSAYIPSGEGGEGAAHQHTLVDGGGGATADHRSDDVASSSQRRGDEEADDHAVAPHRHPRDDTVLSSSPSPSSLLSTVAGAIGFLLAFTYDHYQCKRMPLPSIGGGAAVAGASRAEGGVHGAATADAYLGVAFCYEGDFLFIIILATVLYAFVVLRCFKAPFLPIDGGKTDPNLIVDCAVLVGLAPHSGSPLPSLAPSVGGSAAAAMALIRDAHSDNDDNTNHINGSSGGGRYGGDYNNNTTTNTRTVSTTNSTAVVSAVRVPLELTAENAHLHAQYERYTDYPLTLLTDCGGRTVGGGGGEGPPSSHGMTNTSYPCVQHTDQSDAYHFNNHATATTTANATANAVGAPSSSTAASSTQPSTTGAAATDGFALTIPHEGGDSSGLMVGAHHGDSCCPTNAPLPAPSPQQRFSAPPPSAFVAANFPQGTWCDACKLPKPLRAKHCHACGRCVLGMDHHCPWIGTCVGPYNRLPFTLLTASMLLVFTRAIAEVFMVMNLLSLLEWTLLGVMCFVLLLVLFVTGTQLVVVGQGTNSHELMRGTLYNRLKETLAQHRQRAEDLWEASADGSDDEDGGNPDDNDDADARWTSHHSHHHHGGGGNNNSGTGKGYHNGISAATRRKHSSTANSSPPSNNNKASRRRPPLTPPYQHLIAASSSAANSRSGCMAVLGRFKAFAVDEALWLIRKEGPPADDAWLYSYGRAELDECTDLMKATQMVRFVRT